MCYGKWKSLYDSLVLEKTILKYHACLKIHKNSFFFFKFFKGKFMFSNGEKKLGSAEIPIKHAEV